MAVLNQMTDILEHGQRCYWAGWSAGGPSHRHCGGWKLGATATEEGCSLELGACVGLRSRLINLINPIGPCPVDHAPLAAPPHHLDPHPIAHAPCRKHTHRIIAGQIPPAADHFLALHRHGSAIQPDPGPDPTSVCSLSLQPHCDPRLGPFVSIHPRFVI